MAKTKKTTSSAPNQSLIQGASFASKAYTSGAGAAFILSAGEQAESDKQRREQIKRQNEEEMGAFIDNMPANVDLEKVPQQLRPTMNKYLVNAKQEYFEAARLASQADKNSPIYMESIERMNNIIQSFSTMNNELNTILETRKQAIEDFDQGLISNGNRPEDIKIIKDLTTGQMPMSISDNGHIMLGENGAMVSDLPKYHYKDFATANSLIELNKTLYNQKEKLEGGRRDAVEMQLRTQLTQGGRNAIVSMATDDHVIPGGLGIADEDLINNPARTEELKEKVIQNYMSVLERTALDGFNAKQEQIKRQEDAAVRRSKRLAGIRDSESESKKQSKQEEIDTQVQGRVDLANEYVNRVKSGDASALKGLNYRGKEIFNAVIVGPETRNQIMMDVLGIDEQSAIENAWFKDRKKRNLQEKWEELGYKDGDIIVTIPLSATQLEYVAIDPNDEQEMRNLMGSVVKSKFGSDAITDKAISIIESGNRKPLP